MWEKYADSKSHVSHSWGAKVEADGVAEEVPGAMKESCPGPDPHFAPGSFGELPGVVAFCEISGEGGKRGKEEETGDSGWRGRGAQPFSKLGRSHQLWGRISSISWWMRKTQHLGRPSTVPGRLWAKMPFGLNFAGKGEHDKYKSHHATPGKRQDKRYATLPEKSKQKLKTPSKTEIFSAQMSLYLFQGWLAVESFSLLVWNILK